MQQLVSQSTLDLPKHLRDPCEANDMLTFTYLLVGVTHAPEGEVSRRMSRGISRYTAALFELCSDYM